MRSIPVCLPFQNTTLSRPDSMECSTCWDEMRTPWCSVDWAELQALCGWRLCTPGTSQSITPYSIANPLPSHVTFSGNKQLFYGSHPRRLSEDAAITQWETYGTTSSLFSSALLSSLLRVSSLCTFSMIDRAGITWHIADPFHKGTYLLAQLLSLAYFLQKNSCWKHPWKWQNNPPHISEAQEEQTLGPSPLGYPGLERARFPPLLVGIAGCQELACLDPLDGKLNVCRVNFTNQWKLQSFVFTFLEACKDKTQIVVSTCVMFSILSL